MQQLTDKIRAAGHVTAEDMQSCVENFRVDNAMILKVRDAVSVARRKLLPRGFALMTPRVVVPAVWLPARAHPMCELRCASCARSRSLHVHAPRVRARPPGTCLQVCGACSRRGPAKTYS